MFNIKNRTQSGFPVAIGTGLALETLHEPVIAVYDPSRTVPPRVNINEYEIIYFNARTIFRNIVGSIPSGEQLEVPVADYVRTLEEECGYLYDLLGLEDAEIEIYYSDYEYCQNTYPGKYRVPKTTRQIMLHEYEEKAIKNLVLHHPVKKFKGYFKPDGANVLIFTHIPFDLLMYKGYMKFNLLESHTGKIKQPHEFGSKYMQVDDEDMSLIEFREDLLVRFGDHVMFKPDMIKDRRELYKTVVKKNNTFKAK
jgi:hypothetical protein